VCAGCAPAFAGAPVPCGVEIGNDCGAARQDRVVTVLAQSVDGVREAGPVASGHVGAVDGEGQEGGRPRQDDSFFDGAPVEVAVSFGAWLRRRARDLIMNLNRSNDAQLRMAGTIGLPDEFSPQLDVT